MFENRNGLSSVTTVSSQRRLLLEEEVHLVGMDVPREPHVPVDVLGVEQRQVPPRKPLEKARQLRFGDVGAAASPAAPRPPPARARSSRRRSPASAGCRCRRRAARAALPSTASAFGLTASTSASVSRQSIFSRSSVPTSVANCRTTPGSSVSRRKALRDICRCWPMRNSTSWRPSARDLEPIEHGLRHARRSPRRGCRPSTCRRRGSSSASTSSSGARSSPRIEPNRSRDWLVGLEQPLDAADGQQRVLVDRVLVVEVADHAARDGLELREQPRQQAAVVHLGEPGVQARPRPQEPQQPLAIASASAGSPTARNRPACRSNSASASSATGTPRSSAASKRRSHDAGSRAARAARRRT